MDHGVMKMKNGVVLKNLVHLKQPLPRKLPLLLLPKRLMKLQLKNADVNTKLVVQVSAVVLV